MKLDNVLSGLIELYSRTTPFPSNKLEFSFEELDISSSSFQGELLYYYQHVQMKGDCYFGNSNFNLILLPLHSEFTTVEHWALQDYEEFIDGKYQIFACTDSDAIIFCDITHLMSPVYAGRPGDPDFYQLSNSLTEFFMFYIAFTKMQQTREFETSTEYFAETAILIEKYISENSQNTAKKFLLH